VRSPVCRRRVPAVRPLPAWGTTRLRRVLSSDPPDHVVTVREDVTGTPDHVRPNRADLEHQGAGGSCEDLLHGVGGIGVGGVFHKDDVVLLYLFRSYCLKLDLVLWQ